MDRTSQNFGYTETLVGQQSSDTSSIVQRGRQYGDISVNGNGLTIVGDVHNHETFERPQDVAKFGLCLGAAPQLAPEHFIGRAIEMEIMRQYLQPGTMSIKQQRLVLGGMGGIGKTQLAIAYAERHRECYDSIFWLNATSELTLYAGLQLIAGRIVKAKDLVNLGNDQILMYVHEWLSDVKNTRWLLIFDNYDEPTDFDIVKYCPYAAHGSVIITTRLPDLVRISSRQVRMQPIVDIAESLEILRTRSQRENATSDPYAQQLAKRLDGLPLALATAGVYLSKSASMTFQKYLQIYNERWHVDRRQSLQLQEYHSDQTLYTTWNITFARLEDSDPLAARTLQLLAYFDNQSIWYELLHVGLSNDLPEWLQELCAERTDFESAMRTLVDYCLVEVRPGMQSYSVHSCVHDWTLAKLNHVFDPQFYWYAVTCVTVHLKNAEWTTLAQPRYAPFTPHAVRCTTLCLKHDVYINGITSSYIHSMNLLAELLYQQVQYSVNEQFCKGLLALYEKLLGSDHRETLVAITRLGELYYQTGKMDQAQMMYQRALSGQEKFLGLHHTDTLDTIIRLGLLYIDQRKFVEAKQMFLRAAIESERLFGSDHALALRSKFYLGISYRSEGKYDDAEQIYTQVLGIYEKTLPSNDPSTLNVVTQFGDLYKDTSRFDEAEQMYLRALLGREKTLGPGHFLTLASKHALAVLYYQQGRLDQSEQLDRQLVAEYLRAPEMNSPQLSRIFNNLGLTYAEQGQLDKAEQMYLQALSGYEKSSRDSQYLIPPLKLNLAMLYRRQGRTAEAEKIEKSIK